MNEATVIRLESTKEVVSFLRSEEVEESLEGVWVKDKDALHSLDPEMVEWIVRGLIATLQWLIPWLAKRAREEQAPITVKVPLETSNGVKMHLTLEIPPHMSDEALAAAVQRIRKALE